VQMAQLTTANTACVCCKRDFTVALPAEELPAQNTLCRFCRVGISHLIHDEDLSEIRVVGVQSVSGETAPLLLRDYNKDIVEKLNLFVENAGGELRHGMVFGSKDIGAATEVESDDDSFVLTKEEVGDIINPGTPLSDFVLSEQTLQDETLTGYVDAIRSSLSN